MSDTDVQRLEREAISQLLIDLMSPRRDVYAAADLFVYYEEGNPKKKVAPDVFFCLDVPSGKRDVFLTWQEGHGVDWALEIVSKGTWKRDLLEKPTLYGTHLGTREYYVFDPQGLYLPEPLMAFDFVSGTPVHREPSENGRFTSTLLGLELGLERLVPQERGVQQAWELHFFKADGSRVLRRVEALREAEQTAEAAKQAAQAAEQAAQAAEQAAQAAEQAAQAAEQKALDEGKRRAELEEMLREARKEIERLSAASVRKGEQPEQREG